MAKTPQKKQWRWGDGVAAIIAQLDEIERWRATRQSMKAYYEANQTRLPMTYEYFVRTAAALRKEHSERGNANDSDKRRHGAAEAPPPAASSSSPPPPASQPAKRKQEPETSTGKFERFNYNPNADLEDLI